MARGMRAASEASFPSGLCAVYKPAGSSSFAIVARVRDILKRAEGLRPRDPADVRPRTRVPQPKVGHGGTSPGSLAHLVQHNS